MVVDEETRSTATVADDADVHGEVIDAFQRVALLAASQSS
jgi:hypothetical protein